MLPELAERGGIGFGVSLTLVHADLLDRNRRRPAAGVAFGGHDHVEVGSQLQPALGPGLEVVARGNLAAGALVTPDRPKLVEGLPPLDRRLIDALRLVNVIRAAVTGDAAFALRPLAGVVAAEVLDDVVLDERLLGPAVEGQVRVALRVVRALILDRLVAARIPALSVGALSDPTRERGFDALLTLRPNYRCCSIDCRTIRSPDCCM